MNLPNLLVFNNLFLNGSSGLQEAIGGTTYHVSELVNYFSEEKEVYCAGYCVGFEGNNRVKPLMSSLSKTNTAYLKHILFQDFTKELPANTVIHAHRPDHLAVLKNKRKLKTVLTLHGQARKTIDGQGSFFKKSIYHLLEKQGIKKADRIIAVEEITKEYYIGLFPEIQNKITVVPIGIDLDFFKPLEKLECCKKLQLDSEKKYIVYVGRLDFPKNVKEIIDAFTLAFKTDNNLHLLVVGEGKDKPMLMNYVADSQTKSAITFTGFQPRELLPYFYNASEMSILLSGNEGSPTSVKESFACGVPVLANNVGDLGNIIQNGKNGELVNTIEIELIANKIIELVNKKPDAEECRNSVLEFSNKLIFGKIKEIYHSLTPDN